MDPTQQTQEEADRAELVYSYVLSQIGVKTTAEVLALWQDIPAGNAAQTAASWLDRAVELILTRRSQAEALGLAYYRLVRALRTGTTIPSPYKRDEPERVSLEMLRQEFEALVAEHTGEGSTEVNAPDEPSGDDDSIVVEESERLPEALAASGENVIPYTETLLKEMADVASNKVNAIPDDTPNKDARATARALHLQHGAMIAASGSRIAMNGGRNATNQASARDPRVKGWVRQHGGNDRPCYFCAMLISRRVLYKSEMTAGLGPREDGRVFLGDGLFKFHDNCHCRAVEVFSDVDFMSNPKYAQNRKYADLWDRHIKDKFSGREAINEWRKLLQREQATKNNSATQAVAA
jgi:hypothetical protein